MGCFAPGPASEPRCAQQRLLSRFNALNDSVMKNTQLRGTFLAIIAAVAAGVSAQAQNLVVNGGFELTSNGANKQADRDTQATGWTSTLVPQSSYWAGVGMGSYSFILGGASSSAPSYTDSPGTMNLWTATNGGSGNNLAEHSPDGGNFWMTDAGWNTGKLEQTISGLSIGDSYTLTFYSAGAQQYGYTGDTSTRWGVTLGGNPVQYTSWINVGSTGSSAWTAQSMTFIADGSSAVLSFLADGTPSGLPPMALLDGVSLTLTVVPEPSTYAAVAGGLLVLVGVARRRMTK